MLRVSLTPHRNCTFQRFFKKLLASQTPKEPDILFIIIFTPIGISSTKKVMNPLTGTASS